MECFEYIGVQMKINSRLNSLHFVTIVLNFCLYSVVNSKIVEFGQRYNSMNPSVAENF